MSVAAPVGGVSVEELPGGQLPLLVGDGSLSLPQLIARDRAWIDALLLARGGLWFRGFAIDTAPAFRSVVDAMESSPLAYVYRSTPRTEVGAGIYTATEYPPRQTIPLHCENAYARAWPMKLFFCCARAAPEGGETPLARVAHVTSAISEPVKRRFAEKGVMYVRNYGAGVDLPWETVFQTDDRAEVERFCRANEIAFTWKDDGGLRTSQVCQGLAVHPRTGERVWFNQANLFHPSALDPATREALASLFAPEDYPRNAFYGDGSPIEADVLAEIRAAFDAALFAFPWQQGDVVLVDNMQLAHGRRPFKGPRQVFVAMSEVHEPGGDPLAPAAPAG